MEDERLLVERLLKGDQEAWNQFWKRYSTQIFHAAYSVLRNSEDAEDVTQDVFVGLYQGRGLLSFGFDSKLRTWLHRIAMNNNALRLWQKATRHKQFSLSPEEAVPDHSPDHVRTRVNHEICTKLLNALSEANRAVASLHYLKELSYAEIASELKIPEGTVGRRLTEARRLMNQHAKKEGFL